MPLLTDTMKNVLVAAKRELASHGNEFDAEVARCLAREVFKGDGAVGFWYAQAFDLLKEYETTGAIDKAKLEAFLRTAP